MERRRTGGISFDKIEILNSYSTADVTGDRVVGGLVGNNASTVSNSYATGNVSGDWDVGGLVGWNIYPDSDSKITGSYATGDVYGNNRVGGLACSSRLKRPCRT